ncbi:MAG: fasciclin domain-containing protein [Anaerolineae bacterium]|jgi:phosphate transport system substrate-binding protein|nr:fasciclin domain-containing protein [Anaerolineae bacterium]
MKNRFVALLMVLALLVSAGATFAQEEKTIAQLAAETPELSTLLSLVEAAGLAEVLNSTDAEFTIFAPTNDAFAALPSFVVEYVTSDVELLTAVLTYHALPAAVTSDAVSPMMAATVNGGELTIDVVDGMVKVDQATVVTADIIASNGVIHIIDSVLVPTITLPEVIPADVTGDISIAGSSTVFPLTQFILDQFVAEGYAGTITNDSVGTGAGFERFCTTENATDISNASRAIREEEAANCEAAGRPNIGLRVGDDGIAVVANPANEFLTDLTAEQLALAFSTAVTWADVDPSFPAEPIIRYSPGTDSGTFDFFVEEALDDNADALLNATELNLSEDDNVLLEGVANNVNAIGYFGFAYYTENAADLKIISIDGVLATPETVASGDYALARPLFIYTAIEVFAAKPQVASFVSYYLTNDEAAIEATGYFPANKFDQNIARLLVAAAMHSAMMGGM